MQVDQKQEACGVSIRAVHDVVVALKTTNFFSARIDFMVIRHKSSYFGMRKFCRIAKVPRQIVLLREERSIIDWHALLHETISSTTGLSTGAGSDVPGDVGLSPPIPALSSPSSPMGALSAPMAAGVITLSSGEAVLGYMWPVAAAAIREADRRVRFTVGVKGAPYCLYNDSLSSAASFRTVIEPRVAAVAASAKAASTLLLMIACSSLSVCAGNAGALVSSARNSFISVFDLWKSRSLANPSPS